MKTGTLPSQVELLFESLACLPPTPLLLQYKRLVFCLKKKNLTKEVLASVLSHFFVFVQPDLYMVLVLVSCNKTHDSSPGPTDHVVVLLMLVPRCSLIFLFWTTCKECPNGEFHFVQCAQACTVSCDWLYWVFFSSC